MRLILLLPWNIVICVQNGLNPYTHTTNNRGEPPVCETETIMRGSGCEYAKVVDQLVGANRKHT